MWRKGDPFALLAGMQIGAATVESSIEIPQKVKNGSAFRPSYPISGNTRISEGTQNTNSKEYNHPYVHWSIIYNCQDMEAAQVSISRWVDKTMDIYIMEYYSAIKKKILPFVTAWMDLENIMLTEISQSEKE